jgi:hypothetical protein
VLVQEPGDHLDVARVRLEPLVVLVRDAVDEDVHGLRLAAEARGELLGGEDVGRSAIVATPAIVSWSVMVTRSIPRRLARA